MRSSVSLGFDVTSKADAEIAFKTTRISIPDAFSKNTLKCGVDYALSKRWKLSASCHYSFLSRLPENMNESGEETSDKLKLAADLVYEPKRLDNDLKITSRLRFQHTLAEDKKPKDYLRNKTTLDYKISKAMKPYIALEPYFNLHSNRFSYLRFYIGNEMTLRKTKIDLYYIAEARLKQEHFGIQYIIGADFRFNYKDQVRPLIHKRSRF